MSMLRFVSHSSLEPKFRYYDSDVARFLSVDPLAGSKVIKGSIWQENIIYKIK